MPQKFRRRTACQTGDDDGGVRGDDDDDDDDDDVHGDVDGDGGDNLIFIILLGASKILQENLI